MSQYGDRHATALSLLHRGRPAEAERVLRNLLLQAHVRDEEYDEWLRTLVDAYRAQSRLREAGSVLLYLHRFPEAVTLLHKDGAAADAARARELWGRSEPLAVAPRGAPSGEAAENLLSAARGYEEAGLPVQAAIAFAASGNREAALRAWERVARDPRIAALPYEQALSAYNLGLAARAAGHADSADQQLARAQRLLEEVADDFETRGERERAFDCYAILLHLGRELGSFENLAEGYINCIRVLKEDNLKFYVLQYYEDFLRLALSREEFHAAATVCKEAADYARRLGLVYDRSYLKRCAETWGLLADKNERDGGPVELSENALLSAVDAYAGLGDFYRVQACYQRLGRLALSDGKRERYRKVVERYAGVVDTPQSADAVPEYLKQQHAYPPIWELDLVEWELDGDQAAVCALIAGDRRQPAMIRRRALAVLLAELEGVRAGTAHEPARLAAVAQGLGELQSYQALRPLEKLYAHPEAAVRRGVMRALRFLYFKRTFQLLSRGLRDEDEGVRKAALEALEGLHFPHAFDPLARIFREHAEPRVKVAALTSIGRIATLEAGEFLIEALRHEPEAMREVARRLLWNFENPDIYPILRRHLEVESGPARADLELILRGVPGR